MNLKHGIVGKQFLLPVLIIVCSIASILGYGFNRIVPPVPAIAYYYETPIGNCVFTHGRHSDEEVHDLTCGECHHEILSEEYISCANCHGEGSYEPDWFEHSELTEYHRCSQCHPENPDISPVSCSDCHTENAAAFTPGGCETCHDPSYSPDEYTHSILILVDGHECSFCHSPAALSDSFHNQCSDCHRKLGADLFIINNETRCQACHLKM